MRAGLEPVPLGREKVEEKGQVAYEYGMALSSQEGKVGVGVGWGQRLPGMSHICRWWGREGIDRQGRKAGTGTRRSIEGMAA